MKVLPNSSVALLAFTAVLRHWKLSERRTAEPQEVSEATQQ